MKTECIYFIICFLLVTIGGCVHLEKQYPDIEKYSLHLNRVHQDSDVDSRYFVKVRSFNSAPLFADKTFVYRTGTLTYEQDYYNQFMLFPTAMITEEIRKWFASAPHLMSIIDNTSIIPADFEITGTIIALYGDIQDKKTPQACLSLEFVVFDIHEIPAQILLKRSYKQVIPLERLTIVDLVAGWNTALRNIMYDFEKDLEKVLKEQKEESEVSV